MKKFIVLLSIVALFSVFVISSSAGVPLTDLEIYRDLDVSFNYTLNTVIHCEYKVGGLFYGNGTSITECETSSDQFCYVWVRNEDHYGNVSFHDIYGNVKGVLKTNIIRLKSSYSAISTWHGAYRNLGTAPSSDRNLDARVEFWENNP